MSVTILVLVLLSGCMLITAKNNCKGLNGNFSTSSHIFTNCVLEHNEEATFCLDCIIDYKIFRAKYNDLVTGNDTTGSCRSRFIDNNQLDIVESVYANTKRLWDSGFCSDCFATDCDYADENTDCTRSNHTGIFKSHFDNTSFCINHHAEDPCKNCLEEYTKMNDYYNEIRFKTTDKFCFAIKDMMNKTRIQWSKKLHCCEDRKNSTEYFLVLSSSSVFVTIVFYVAVYLFGLRKERIHYIPDDLMPHSSEDQTNEAIMNINSKPSTSETPKPELRKIINLSESDESDDDQILPMENPNLIHI